MSEALLVKDSDVVDETTPSGGLTSGEVVQLADGRAGIVIGLTERTEDDPVGIKTTGRVTLAKTSGVVCLKGGRCYWDRSANTCTPLKAAAGADFFVGAFADDAASADTTVDVYLNVNPRYEIDMHRDPGTCVKVLTAGTPYIVSRGASVAMGFSATAEAQRVDWLSLHSVPVTMPMIFEAIFEVSVACDADVGDFNIGLANGTHASDCDSINESCFFHNDSGADLNLDAESDDGTTEVAATDTTVDLVAYTPVEVWIDARDLTDIILYVNGVRKLSTSTFKLNLATGPLKALAHFEKSSNDSLGEFTVHFMGVRVLEDLGD